MRVEVALPTLEEVEAVSEGVFPPDFKLFVMLGPQCRRGAEGYSFAENGLGDFCRQSSLLPSGGRLLCRPMIQLIAV